MKYEGRVKKWNGLVSRNLREGVTPPPFAENNYFFPKKIFKHFFGLK